MKTCKTHKRLMVKTNEGEWVCPDCHVEQTEDEFLDEYGVEITDSRTGETVELSWRELIAMSSGGGKSA